MRLKTSIHRSAGDVHEVRIERPGPDTVPVVTVVVGVRDTDPAITEVIPHIDQDRGRLDGRHQPENNQARDHDAS